jgi:Family of unknown function (DUF6328)
MAEPPDDEPDDHEEAWERTERQLIELLNELRVVIPGVQVLFAFLLTIPFNQRFDEVSDLDRTVYLVTLLLSALSAALFLAPSAYHRLLFHHRDREHIIEVANRFAIAGLVVLSFSVTGAVLLVTDFLYSSTALVAGTTIGTFLVLAVLWGALPLARRVALRRRRSG